MASMPEAEAQQPQPRLRLTAARMERKMSQQEVADELGTTHVNVSRWERGITKPNPYFRRKLSKLFGKTEQELDLIPEFPPSTSSVNNQQAGVTTPTTVTASDPAVLRTTVEQGQPLYDPAIPLQPAIRLIGRDNDIARIKRRLCAGGNVALTALNGLPGVGKTALSITLAHDKDVRAYFKDGILWAGLGPNPNVPGLMSRWGALLGISATEMASLSDPEAWAKALRSAIGARTMLLVIDDAWKLEEALALKVGGANCAHLLTTRYRDIAAQMTVEGATEIQELNEEESMTLLRELAPGVIDRETQKAQALVQAVGGLPLALTLMGNYLRKQAYSGQTRRITAALERLSNAAERLKISEPHGPAESHPSLTSEMQLSLQSVISITDQILPEKARAALYALSVFPPKPNSFSEEAALAAINGDVELLDILLDAGLLESNGSDRYLLHQTISDYSRLRLQGTEVQERLMSYVINFLESHKKDYAALELENSTILAALEYAYELQKKAELVQIVIDFMPYFLRGGFYTQAEKHLQRAREAAVELGDSYDLANILLHIGQITHQQGNFAQAEATFQEGLNLARPLEDEELISALLNDLGWATCKLGKLTEAEAYLQEGLTLARRIGDKERICAILKVLGLVGLYSGNYIQAEAHLQEGLTLAHQIGDYEQACLLLLNLGVAAGEQGNFPQAEAYFQESLELARQMGHREQISNILANLGAAVTEQGNYAQAEKYFLEGLEIAREIEHSEWTSFLLLNLGTVMRKQGRFSQAEPYLLESLTFAQKIHNPYLLAIALCECGSLYLGQNRLKDAEDSFHKMLNNIPEDHIGLKALADYGLAQTAFKQGNTDNAYILGEASLAVLEKIGDHHANEVRQWLSSIKSSNK